MASSHGSGIIGNATDYKRTAAFFDPKEEYNPSGCCKNNSDLDTIIN